MLEATAKVALCWPSGRETAKSPLLPPLSWQKGFYGGEESPLTWSSRSLTRCPIVLGQPSGAFRKPITIFWLF